jgi:hypothetical protein
MHPYSTSHHAHSALAVLSTVSHNSLQRNQTIRVNHDSQSPDELEDPFTAPSAEVAFEATPPLEGGGEDTGGADVDDGGDGGDGTFTVGLAFSL